MRFYFQDDSNKVVTKCIRVSSKTTVAMLMDTLVEKFCPDLKMLSHPNYELFECHEKGGKLVTHVIMIYLHINLLEIFC